MALSYEVSWPYLIELGDSCTCGAGPNGYYGMHESFCGAEPCGRLDGDNPNVLGSMLWEVN